ncbi:pentapeptide repeat-containing protein [Paenibacillus sp. NPDC058071]|uniref:pentapeptide repeat-containing protein n=1 Tax=Paenibacillus sp. NPDC058071 TaxID=3346326 RepID=UPI0036DD4E22
MMKIVREMKVLEVSESNVAGSSFNNVNAGKMSFECCNLAQATFNNVNLTGMKIIDANMSEFEVSGAQWGGAHFQHIGYYNPGDPESKPHSVGVRLTDCDLSNGKLENCNLSHLALSDCDITGLTIDGVRIDELLSRYLEQNKQTQD